MTARRKESSGLAREAGGEAGRGTARASELPSATAPKAGASQDGALSASFATSVVRVPEGPRFYVSGVKAAVAMEQDWCESGRDGLAVVTLAAFLMAADAGLSSAQAQLVARRARAAEAQEKYLFIAAGAPARSSER